MMLKRVLDQIDEQEAVEFLRHLVRMRTVNPPGNEGPLAKVIAEKLEGLGFDIKLLEAEENRSNVIATLPGTIGSPTLLLNGHIDTLPAGPGWKVDPFGAEIIDDKIYGLGTVDMKAGVAAFIMAANAICKSGVKLKGTLLLTIVADEVSGGYKGTGYIVQQGAVKADMGVVCEPSGPEVHIAHRGALWLEITIMGKSAPGSRPWLGVNAISKMAKVIRAIEEQLPPILAQKKHWILHPPSFNIGAIQGGTKVNMVPGMCKIELDRRWMPGETSEEAIAEIAGIIEALKAVDEDLEVEIKKLMEVPPVEISPDERIVSECKKAFQQVMGEEPELGSPGGFEDTHFLVHQAKIPTAMFGPYRPALEDNSLHMPFSGVSDECVEIKHYMNAVKIYTALILNVLG